MKRSDINQYLYFGYTDNEFQLVDYDVLKANADHDYSKDGSVKVWNELVCRIIALIKPCKGKIIVPISGGWDSRILLCAIVKHIDRSKIVAYTFGSHGQLDFDIGRKLCRKLNVEHKEIDLATVNFSWHELVESAKTLHPTYLHEAIFNKYCQDTLLTPDDILVSGFMGDAITGGHLSTKKTESEKLQEFTRRQRKIKSIKLWDKNYTPNFQGKNIAIEGLDSSELLDIYFRQRNCIYPILFGGNANFSFGIKTITKNNKTILHPFLDEKWVNYWLNSPIELKRNQNRYLFILDECYPDVVGFPSKYSFGYDANKVASIFIKKSTIRLFNKINNLFPSLKINNNALENYYPLDYLYRKSDSHYNLWQESSRFLKSNNIVPWLDLNKIHSDHLEYKANYGEALQHLVNLAAYCSANNIKVNN
ncbi:7-cyano-7-deazaguanine synthase [Vibrio cyclitrophicus]|uniref:7-cyano-7-deazaguanine synthase n=1 Tax=Vibrio cyclitrophicus TaxID=47951 RepID=UPI00080E19BC|nr:7-cyano-7-deazaguanine synthase [Vibrio cyclitrophicus]OCH40309.1 hypothetical protein A6E07_10985 [Vibrio cyclitrophicus]